MRTYYELCYAPADRAVVRDSDIGREVACPACAAARPKGYRAGTSVVIAHHAVSVEDARSRADLPSDGIACDYCAATIVGEACRCGFRRDETCVCEDDRRIADEYRPVRTGSASWDS